MSPTGNSLPPGTAPVKAEYIISAVPKVQSALDDDSAESAKNHLNGYDPNDNAEDAAEQEEGVGPRRRKKSLKEERKKRTGANKGRRFGKVRDELELCWKIATGVTCEFGDNCRNSHDIEAYLSQKPKDIKFPAKDAVRFPLIPEAQDGAGDNQELASSIDPSAVCPIFEESGTCRHGLRCRFLGAHVRRSQSGSIELVSDEDKAEKCKLETTELNYLSLKALREIRSKKYPYPIADAFSKETPKSKDLSKDNEVQASDVSAMVVDENTIEAEKDTPDVPLRFNEKKRLHWKDLLYLAPLTTVGNLPFRRLCVTLGADITCGEMGLATSFMQGSKEEWSLVRRHSSERVFGVQLAGSKPFPLMATAETLAKEFGPSGIDFVDLNCGCPIDLVFRSGSGSALLDTPGKLGKILMGMNKALGEIPLTVKLRTGVKDGKSIAHKLMPRLSPEWGVAAATLHGRTRQQRYTKLADWDYIKECVEAVREREEAEGLQPIPIFGGGDCYSSQSYYECVEKSGVDGVMIGRGALIKPWIFTEIKERREWDISSRERLELIRKYAEYGINHFGSDTAGVNTTRRFLCEALSFQHRYIPIGLLEVLPGKLNDRPPAFRGRDDLETLLASPDSRDWVKISEMFLGPVPDGWTFTPKHKSNAYGSEEGQG